MVGLAGAEIDASAPRRQAVFVAASGNRIRRHPGALALTSTALTHPGTIVLCGPQRLRPTVGAIARDLGLVGSIGLITAGWQERETEDEELRGHLGLPAINLRLYGRWEEIFRADPEYFDLHRRRQDKLRRLQRLHRRRLSPAVAVCRAMLRRAGEAWLIAPEQAAAIEALAALDAHHLARVKAIHREFEAEVNPGKRPIIAAQRAALAETLAGVDAVAIAGGHVAVLLNRLRLLALRPLLAERTVIAWSAGAMAMTERVLLFHDMPPQGAGDAEMLDHGLGLAPGVVVLPHAHRRLRLQDAHRVDLMARRLHPARCLALADGAQLRFVGGRLQRKVVGIQQLGPSGGLQRGLAPVAP